MHKAYVVFIIVMRVYLSLRNLIGFQDCPRGSYAEAIGPFPLAPCGLTVQLFSGTFLLQLSNSSSACHCYVADRERVQKVVQHDLYRTQKWRHGSLVFVFLSD